MTIRALERITVNGKAAQSLELHAIWIKYLLAHWMSIVTLPCLIDRPEYGRLAAQYIYLFKRQELFGQSASRISSMGQISECIWLTLLTEMSEPSFQMNGFWYVPIIFFSEKKYEGKFLRWRMVNQEPRNFRLKWLRSCGDCFGGIFACRAPGFTLKKCGLTALHLD